MPYRLLRPARSDTKQTTRLPAAQSQPLTTTKSNGHFDPFDLIRRLEIHQAQCEASYRLHRERVREKGAQKSRAAGGDKLNATKKSDTAASTLDSKRESGSAPDSAIVEHAVLPPAICPENPPPRQRKIRQSVRKISIQPVPIIEPTSTLQGPIYYLRENVILGLQQPAGSHAPRGNEKETCKKGPPGKPQSFKIYSSEVSHNARPKTVALNIPHTPASKNDPSFVNGSYIPKNAASGLTKTTRKEADDRGKRTKRLQTVALSSETSKKPSRVTQQNEGIKIPVIVTKSSIEFASHPIEHIKLAKNASLQSIAEAA